MQKAGDNKLLIKKCNFFYIVCCIFKGARTIAPEKNCPPVRVRVWFRVSVRIRFGGQFSSGAIVLEPFSISI